MLQDNGIGHFEEPCPYWEIEQTPQVRVALDLDTTDGEQDCEFPIWARMFDLCAVDVAQPDVMYMGGITRKALPNAGKYLELSIAGLDYYPWQDRLFLGDPYRVDAGRVMVPDAPDWGIEINPDWLDRATYRISEIAG